MSNRVSDYIAAENAERAAKLQEQNAAKNTRKIVQAHYDSGRK